MKSKNSLFIPELREMITAALILMLFYQDLVIHIFQSSEAR
jgi:hypothetical protein